MKLTKSGFLKITDLEDMFIEVPVVKMSHSLFRGIALFHDRFVFSEVTNLGNHG